MINIGKYISIKSIYSLVAFSIFNATIVYADPVLISSDYIDDSLRTHFNGFENIPTTVRTLPHLVYSGGAGPYVEDGISVQQLNGDSGNDILVNSSFLIYEGNRSWYPFAGDHGYTKITMADGSDFIDFGFYALSGSSGPPALLLNYQLFLDGALVLIGSTPVPNYGDGAQYVGFGGAGFDIICLSVLNRDGANILALDSLETAGGTAASSVPEPTSLILLGTGLCVFVLAAWRRRK
jgi:hypothetical protein